VARVLAGFVGEWASTRALAGARIRLIRQTEGAECGLACFVMVANCYGANLDLAMVRREAAFAGRGASFRLLSTLAERHGFDSRSVEARLDDLRELAPMIVHWDGNHFVVMEAIRGDRALIHDPSGSSGWMSLERVATHYTGFALELTPARLMARPITAKRHGLAHLIPQGRAMAPKLMQALALTLILNVAALATPYFAQLALDRALPQGDGRFLAAISLAGALFAIVIAGLTILRLRVILSVGATFAEELASTVADRLFRLPVDWFKKRESGDIISRFQAVFPIMHIFAEDLPSIAINGLLAMLMIAMMIAYSPILACISVVALSIYAAIRGALLPRQKQALAELAQAHGREQAFLMGSFHCMRSLRLACGEEARHALWRVKLARFARAEARYKAITSWQGVAQTTLLSLATICAIWIAVTLAMTGRFTTGMIVAFLSYKAQFLAAGFEIVNKWSNFRELDTHLELLGDIVDTPEDIAFAPQPSTETSVVGRIELKGVEFSYGADAGLVLKGVDLTIERGQSLAITGPSGGGKSTLAQIILGLYRPTGGTVEIDGVDLQTFGFRRYYRNVAAVLQDENLFAGSVLENITFSSTQPDMEWLRKCAEAAAISDEIESWPMRYGTLVGEMGFAVSSGQRQRILLARALYSRPQLLVLDEGTAHLDAAREHQVNDAIRKLGITRIIFAHRKETIESADRVLTLRDGKLHEMVPVRSHGDGMAAARG